MIFGHPVLSYGRANTEGKSDRSQHIEEFCELLVSLWDCAKRRTEVLQVEAAI